MDSKWFVARHGDVVGPMAQNEVVAMVAADPDGDLLVWADGFDSWRRPAEVEALRVATGGTEGRGGPSPAARAPAARSAAARGPAVSASAGQAAAGQAGGAHASPAGHGSLAERARHELVSYAIIVAYLYVCFGVILLYKSAVLSHVGVSTVHLGLAAIKALVLGKFLLLLHSARVGEGLWRRSRPIFAIALQALLFAVILVLLSVVEELVVGTIHGKPVRAILSELADGSLAEAAVTSLLMVLVLTPYFAMREINSELGDGVLFRMLMTPRKGR